MEIEVARDNGVHNHSPIFVILPGCGQYLPSLRQLFGKAPVEAWWIACETGDRDKSAKGKSFTRPMPSCVPELLRWLNVCKHQEQQGDTLSKGKIFIIGYSRGARWSINLCLQHAELFDGAVILGSYDLSSGDSAVGCCREAS